MVRTIESTYDPVGNLLSISDPDATYTFIYDEFDRIIREDNAGTPGLPHVILDFTYDVDGNRIGVTDNFGVQVVSTYNDRDLLESRQWTDINGAGGVDNVRIDFAYNDRGDRIGVERYADLAATQLVGSSTAAFDTLGRMTSLSHRDSAGATIADYVYGYDVAGQLVSESINGQTADYSYDLTGQLADADRSDLPDEDYLYDANGNRVESSRHGDSYVTGPNNQVLSDGTFSYEYDDEGNLILKTEIATGETTEYTYDHRNRMTSVVEKTADGTVVQEVAFTYDAMGRRIAKTVNGQTAYTVYDGENAWADFDDGGQVLARYLFADQIDQLLARFKPAEGIVWYLTDRLGSVRDLVNAVGDLIAHVEYDSFGNVLSVTDPAAVDRYLFTGREFDAETGLYYYRARYYDANIGRFVSQDPIGFESGDVNIYRYVKNNVINLIDPSGEISEFSVNTALLAQRAAGLTASQQAQRLALLRLAAAISRNQKLIAVINDIVIKFGGVPPAFIIDALLKKF